MTKVLITGASGNVGIEEIKSLQKINHRLDLYAGLRNVDTDQAKLKNYKIKFVGFDFADISTYDEALDKRFARHIGKYVSKYKTICNRILLKYKHSRYS